MKATSILLLSLMISNVFSQEILKKEIKTEVKEVTVFLDGAQIVRKKSIDLEKGKSIIKFVNLSPFIDSKSVQVKAKGELTVLSVNPQQNYLDKTKKSNELSGLEKKFKVIEDKIKLENTHLSIIKEELIFLQDNRNIGGKNDQVNVTNLQLASEFYSKRLVSLKMKEIEREKNLKNINGQYVDLQNQIKSLTDKKEYPTGEIIVKVEANESSTFSLELNYLVGNAGWFPSYDIRAKNINEPVKLVYKANLKQDTKVDWSNVKLKFSSANPNISGLAPTLKTYYLNYNTLPPTYNLITNNVKGKVVGSNGLPLSGVNVIVEGTTIGTVTDFDGNYSITTSNNSSQLTFSYLGFKSMTLPITYSEMNIVLEEDLMQLEEVVVVGYGSRKKVSEALQNRVSGVNINTSSKYEDKNNFAIPTKQIENQTTVDFEINMPYTIKSDNKSYAVDMEIYNVPAFYQYYCIPKIDKDAFLIAKISDWEKYNLLAGEANIFFEGTYVGKTLMETSNASDTLEVSLGRDKKISVNREKIKEYTNKQFIGSKKEETHCWKTTLKNNKNETINMIILDQTPVSTIEEIEVDILNISNAKHEPETGEVKWEFALKPNSKKVFDLKYSVKYPKQRNLIIE